MTQLLPTNIRLFLLIGNQNYSTFIICYFSQFLTAKRIVEKRACLGPQIPGIEYNFYYNFYYPS